MINTLIRRLRENKTIWNKVKGNILLYTIIEFIIFIILHFTLKLFNIRFRQWVYYCEALLTIIGMLAGIIQILKTKSKKIKIVSSIIGTFIIIVVTFYWQIILLILAFSYSPEHIITKNGKKYVAYVNAFLHVNVSYYEYINPFLVGNKERIYEDYGKGGYDPFDGKHDDRKPERYYYYDNNGNVIKTNVRDNSKNSAILENTNEKDIIENSTEKSSSNKNSKILYKKEFDDKTAIRVVVKDYILAQRSIIGIEKTTDGGNTWTEQIERLDDFIQIHNGSKFVFIDENVGFINDLGLAGTNGDNRSLLVTTNGGKKFTESIIKLDNLENDLYIEDIPYKENDILKLKAYVIEKSEKKYYNFYSVDNGLTWKQHQREL